MFNIHGHISLFKFPVIWDNINPWIKYPLLAVIIILFILSLIFWYKSFLYIKKNGIKQYIKLFYGTTGTLG